MKQFTIILERQINKVIYSRSSENVPIIFGLVNLIDDTLLITYTPSINHLTLDLRLRDTLRYSIRIKWNSSSLQETIDGTARVAELLSILLFNLLISLRWTHKIGVRNGNRDAMEGTVEGAAKRVRHSEMVKEEKRVEPWRWLRS